MIVGAALLKLASAGGCAVAAWQLWRSQPEQTIRRALNEVFRRGDLYYKSRGFRGRELRSYPQVIGVRTYLDRIEAAFKLPVGMEPARITESAWLFRQVFEGTSELTLNDDGRTFIMRKYSASIRAFDYDADDVANALRGLRLPIYVGKSRTGDVAYDMVDHPHLLIAGETGSGKSVALRSILTTLIRQVGANLELYCADLKRSEFHVFRGVANEVVTDVNGLERIVLRLQREMRKRGDLMDAEEVAHIDDLPANKRSRYIVLAIDEVALLKREQSVMDGVEEISTIGRALGVFLVLAMQRPDSAVLDGKLKNNLTVRMAFRHSDAINSRITIGSGEAADINETDKGRMVFKLNGCEFVQGPHLTLESARTLLKPYKKATASPSVKTSAEDIVNDNDDDIIEVGVL